MATKPTQLPRWATAATPDPSSAPAPNGGKQDVGWKTGERPPAYYQNWLQYWNYKWLEYLNDGALQGPHTFNNTVGVTGLVTASAGVTVGANQHITLSGTGEIKHGDRTRVIAALTGWPNLPSEWTPFESGWQTAVGTLTNLLIPIQLNVGDRIKSVSWALANSAATNINASVRQNIGPGASSPGTIPGMIASYTGSTPSGFKTLTPTTPHTVLNDQTIVFTISLSEIGRIIPQIKVVYDHP